MKRFILLTGFILLTATLASAAQTITLHKQNISLKQLFVEIRKQTDCDFLYNPEILAKSKPVNVDAVNSPLSKVLDDCFAGQPLTYVIDQKTIIVREKGAGAGAAFPAITGKVINKDDQTSVSGASVFLNNGTIGVSSNNDGTFKLQNVRPGNYDLVVSIVGFDSWHESISVTGENMNLPVIEIKPKVVALKEVVVKANDDRNHSLNYAAFTASFLGTSALAHQCTIINPEALDFNFVSKKGLLTATTSDFLIVQNNALGYRIKYLLTGFSCDLTGQNVSYNGSVLFEKLEGNAAQQRTWAKKRRQVYETSQMHFLRALLNDQLDEEGFRVLKYATRDSKKILLRSPLNRNSILNKTNRRGVYALGVDSSGLYVEYSRRHHFHENDISDPLSNSFNREASVLSFSGTYLLFDQNGWVLNPNDVTLAGAWGSSRVAEMLPADYEPFEALGTNAVIAAIDTSNAGKQLLALKEHSDSTLNRFPAEKIYLQLDKPSYVVGDTIWMRAWLFNAPTLSLSSRSRLLHIDIADDSGKVVKQCLLQASYGTASGQLALDNKFFKGGDYTLIAYTNWMRNFGNETFFYKRVRIADPGENSWLVNSNISRLPENKAVVKVLAQLISVDKAPLPDSPLHVRVLDGNKSLFRQNIKADKNGLLDFQFALPEKDKIDRVEITNAARTQKAIVPASINNEIDVQFMPESGSLVAGLCSTVGFKAINGDGKSIDVQGAILDGTGREVTSFKSLHKGMGSFVLKPQSGELYTARVSFGHGKTKDFTLPTAKESGIILRVKNTMQGDSVELTLTGTKDITRLSEPYFLIAKARGVICYAAVADFTRGTLRSRISKSLFPTGITHFIVATVQGRPVCERMVYIDHHDDLHVSVQPDQQLYTPKDSIALHIKVTDASGQPVVGSFLAAVTNDALVHADTANNIRSYTLLTSDLKGYVEDPSYYLKCDSLAWHALDNLLLTQGWVGYEPLSETNVQQPEKDYTVSGRVNSAFNAPVKKTDILLFSNHPAILMDTLTNEEGKFTFNHFPRVDTPIFVLQARNRHGKSFNVNIKVDEITPPAFKAPKMPGIAPWYVNIDTTLGKRLKNNIMVHRLQDSIPGINTHHLKEVKVIGKKIVKDSENLNGPGNADIVLDEKDVEAAGKKSFLQLFAQTIPGFIERDSMRRVDQHYEPCVYYTIYHRLLQFIVDGVMITRMYPQLDLKQYLEFNNAENIKGIEIAATDKYVGNYLRRFFPGTMISPDTMAFIEITTRSGSPIMTFKPGLYLYKPLALTWPRQFYKPRYPINDATKKVELRSTIDWEPNIVTDAQGQATVSFFAGTEPSSYTIIVEGGDLNGNLGYERKRITISQDKARAKSK